MPPLSSLLEVASDWILAFLGAVGSGVLALGGYTRSIDSRSRKNERRLEGDPDDPNHEGALNILADTREELQEFREETREDHREVMDRIDDLADEK